MSFKRKTGLVAQYMRVLREYQKVLINSTGIPKNYVICDMTNNTPVDIAQGMINVHYLPVKPIEYITLDVTLDESNCDFQSISKNGSGSVLSDEF